MKPNIISEIIVFDEDGNEWPYEPELLDMAA
jgi:hypothetical protein